MKDKLYLFLLLAAIIFFTASCAQKAKPHFHFYSWKSAYTNDDTAITTFSSMPLQKVYIKILEIKKDKGNNLVPLVSDMDRAGILNRYAAIPVIFLQANVLDNLDDTLIETLAMRIGQAYTGFQKSAPDKNILGELQIDHDWRENQKDKYFLLLSLLKKYVGNDVKLSCKRKHMLT